ncbi:MAG: cobyrinate a,c-diamide synthase [Elusimicrobia bacterium]|nr:cobyrinate a,c-diamide synthase [Elusimicrobiota bacterium]
MNIPRIIVSGTQSGVGKTSVTLALMAAFKKAGIKVQPFKVGPDYIDPSYHQLVTKKPSHNLDTWLLTKEKVQWLFQKESCNCELAIIEGVMGLYDGFGSCEETASTQEIAKLLNCPIILVIDAKKMARSAAALVLGFKSFDPALKISGVILNKVGSLRHYQLLKDAVETYTQIPILGGIPSNLKIHVPERHLGLLTASENKEFKELVNALTDLIDPDPEKNNPGINLDAILKIAKETKPLPKVESPSIEFINNNLKSVKIGIAKDKAFSFYYQANLDLLEQFGAKLITFSPLETKELPEDLSALYFGGGFPEIYAQELQNNLYLKNQIKNLIADGLPVYAECGGLMYLTEAIQDLDGKTYEMVGAIPRKITMTKKLQNFGYKQGKSIHPNILQDKETLVRGHEFHYSKMEYLNSHFSYELTDRKTGEKQLEGYRKNNLLASYLHLHFLTNPEWAQNFVEAAKKYSENSNLKKEAAKV